MPPPPHTLLLVSLFQWCSCKRHTACCLLCALAGFLTSGLCGGQVDASIAIAEGEIALAPKRGKKGKKFAPKAPTIPQHLPVALSAPLVHTIFELHSRPMVGRLPLRGTTIGALGRWDQRLQYLQRGSQQ